MIIDFYNRGGGSPIGSESDPIWNAQKNNYYTKTQADEKFVEKEFDPSEGATANTFVYLTFNDGSEPRYEYADSNTKRFGISHKADNTIDTVYFGDGVEKVGNDVFFNCKGLKSIHFGSNLKEIEQYAFYGCAIERIVFPSTLTTVARAAFYNCTKLKEIKIYATTEPTLGIDPFANVASGGTLYYPSGSTYAQTQSDWHYKLSGWTFVEFDTRDIEDRVEDLEDRVEALEEGGGSETISIYECIQEEDSGNEWLASEITVNGKSLVEYPSVDNEDGTRTYTATYIYEGALLECTFNGNDNAQGDYYIATSTVRVPKDDESLVKIEENNWSTYVSMESKTEKTATVSIDSLYATRTLGNETFTIMANKEDSFKSIYKYDDGEGHVSTNTTDLSSGVYVEYKSEEDGEEVSYGCSFVGEGHIEVFDNLSGEYTSVKYNGIDFNGVMWKFWRGSQDEYDAIEEKDGETLYIITE